MTVCNGYLLMQATITFYIFYQYYNSYKQLSTLWYVFATANWLFFYRNPGDNLGVSKLACVRACPATVQFCCRAIVNLISSNIVL